MSSCRNYLNRVQYYLGLVRQKERNLKLEVKELELDIDFKSKRLLADDESVRRMPNIRDREAMVIYKLSVEHKNLNEKKLELLDLEETVKIIKHKYDHLRSTNNDIRLQRQMVKEELNPFDGSYIPPSVNKDGTVPGGLPPVVTIAKIDPTDLLDPKSRPEDIPEPIDKVHLSQLSAFYNRTSQLINTSKTQNNQDEQKLPEIQPTNNINYRSLLED